MGEKEPSKLRCSPDMAEPYGWTDRSGILWRSKNSKVIVSSKLKRDKSKWRVVVNDEEKAEEQLVVTVGGDEWFDAVMNAIHFAEGYAKAIDE
jgi:hypothetical protein